MCEEAIVSIALVGYFGCSDLQQTCERAILILMRGQSRARTRKCALVRELPFATSYNATCNKICLVLYGFSGRTIFTTSFQSWNWSVLFLSTSRTNFLFLLSINYLFMRAYFFPFARSHHCHHVRLSILSLSILGVPHLNLVDFHYMKTHQYSFRK